MTFTEALSAVFDSGERITRLGWSNPSIYCVMEDHKLMIMNGVAMDGMLHPWCVSEEDYFAEDWEVVE